MIDEEGYRANVGIILCNQAGRLLWARRVRQDSWQFPQGGIAENETPEEAMYRELYEEVGLQPQHVTILSRTNDWLRYQLPSHLIRHHNKPVCIGQKQIWFLLDMKADDQQVRLDACDKPEFDDWCWVDYWVPLDDIIFFKRNVYEYALSEFEPLVLSSKSASSVSVD